jgi:hypothetical protein
MEQSSTTNQSELSSRQRSLTVSSTLAHDKAQLRNKVIRLSGFEELG